MIDVALFWSGKNDVKSVKSQGIVREFYLLWSVGTLQELLLNLGAAAKQLSIELRLHPWDLSCVWGVFHNKIRFINPGCSQPQYSFISAKSWPKIPFIHSYILTILCPLLDIDDCTSLACLIMMAPVKIWWVILYVSVRLVTWGKIARHVSGLVIIQLSEPCCCRTDMILL